MQITNKFNLGVEYQTQIINADGTIAKSNKPKHNLILDAGMDLVATLPFADLFTHCVLGTGTKPVVRDSGAITFDFDGTVTVTASAGFFEAQDNGRIIKFDSGEEFRITAYVSATELTVSNPLSIGAITGESGAIHYVNEITHQTETKRSNTYSTETGDNGTSFAVDTITFKRTFLFTAEVAPITYREIGWSNSGTAGAQLFGRDLIPGIGDSLAAGQQYKVVVRLKVKLSPTTPATVSDVGNNGFNTAGTAAFQYLWFQTNVASGGSSFVQVVENGAKVQNAQNRSLDPALTTQLFVSTTQITLIGATDGSTRMDIPASPAAINLSNSAYTPGSYTRNKSTTFSVSQFNGNIGSLVLVGGGDGSKQRSWVIRFDSVQSKASTHTLGLTFRFSWGRTLNN